MHIQQVNLFWKSAYFAVPAKMARLPNHAKATKRDLRLTGASV